jgi:hypothetical protein
MKASDIDRFITKIEVGDCWHWTAGKHNGYGQFSLGGRKGRMYYAHRVAYEWLVGPIPEGLQLDHLCRNRACVNPDHLEPVSQQENILRGEGGQNHAVKTHCPQGHEYAGDNLYVRPDGGRQCRACTREHQRRKRSKDKVLQEKS